VGSKNGPGDDDLTTNIAWLLDLMTVICEVEGSHTEDTKTCLVGTWRMFMTVPESGEEMNNYKNVQSYTVSYQ
jgi:hypothetical protein